MLDTIQEMVDEMLDQEGDIRIGGVYFVRSQVMKEMDPTAYRQLVLDLADARITDLQDELDCLDPELDADEMAEIQAQIDELENV